MKRSFSSRIKLHHYVFAFNRALPTFKAIIVKGNYCFDISCAGYTTAQF